MSTGDYDDVIADNLKNIETELSNLTETQKVRLDRRLKDLNVAIIGLHNQFAKMNKNLEIQNLILIANSDTLKKNNPDTIANLRNNFKDIIKILENEEKFLI